MKRINKGFTLLELIIAVVILAVLATIAIPTFAKDISNSKTATVSESASAIARNAEGMADTSIQNSGTGSVADANGFVLLAGSEAQYGSTAGSNLNSITPGTVASGWLVTGSNGAQVCLTIAVTPNAANPPFTVTPVYTTAQVAAC